MDKLCIKIIIACSFLYQTSVYAAEKNFTGPAVGVDIGTSKYKSNANYVDMHRLTDVELSTSYGFALGDTDFVGMPELRTRVLGTKKYSSWSDSIGTGHADIHRQYTVSYLQGYRASSNVLPYVRVGYEWSKITDYEQEANGNNKKTKQNFKGPVFGVGVKYAINPNLELGGEYRHSRKKVSDEKVEPGNHFNVGINYRF